MAEEFEEAELIFDQENVDDEDHKVCDFRASHYSSNTAQRKKVNNKPINKTAPMNIPENVTRKKWLRYMESDFDGEIVPPHVIVGRRRVMVHSVCVGKGRTLKGRDLSQVRNSILKMTGFLEN